MWEERGNESGAEHKSVVSWSTNVRSCFYMDWDCIWRSGLKKLRSNIQISIWGETQACWVIPISIMWLSNLCIWGDPGAVICSVWWLVRKGRGTTHSMATGTKHPTFTRGNEGGRQNWQFGLNIFLWAEEKKKKVWMAEGASLWSGLFVWWGSCFVYWNKACLASVKRLQTFAAEMLIPVCLALLEVLLTPDHFAL